MAGEHPLALSLAGGRTKGSPAATTTVASAPPKQRQVPVEIERARRRQMSRLYAELGSLLPDLPPRAPKARILEEAIAYVGTLRSTVAKLEAHGGVAEGAGRRTAADGGGAVAADEVPGYRRRGDRARRPGALTRVLEVFRRHGVPVLAATVTSNAGEAAVTVTTGAVAPSAVEGIKADISRSIA
ncbi:hypothetical protein PVAP13_5KG373907 [Panicum virgatum]|uniref:BHLH domain-containing protein n=1 Tax=Panicum virgatum TaxID=38727 RepID=A0A8T0SLW7_PANVG|nr:hypothetical protein PVAP13_5KG373907 [Panicum virgatum]